MSDVLIKQEALVQMASRRTGVFPEACFVAFSFFKVGSYMVYLFPVTSKVTDGIVIVFFPFQALQW